MIQSFVLEVPADTGVQNIAIPDISFLRGKFVTGIEAYCFETVPNFPNANSTTATAAQLKNIFLQLYIKDPTNSAQEDLGIYVRNIAMIDLLNVAGTAAPFRYEQYELDNLYIQWDKCAFIFGTAPNNNTAFTIAMNIYYSSSPTRKIGEIAGVMDNSIIDWLVSKVSMLEAYIKKLTSGK